MSDTNQAGVKWAANLNGVKEVCLSGSVDLAYWHDRLAAQHLEPAAKDGRAQLLVISVAAQFAGLTFQEINFCVMVREAGDAHGRPASYLIEAFNSRRLFAFCERVFFSTPYSHGDVQVEVGTNASGTLRLNNEVAFQARLQGTPDNGSREPESVADDGWNGAVYLPRRGSGQRIGKLFHVRISGRTQTFPFLLERDELLIRPSAHGGVLQSLLDSDFSPSEWQIRADARHAKSRTYKRRA